MSDSDPYGDEEYSVYGSDVDEEYDGEVAIDPNDPLFAPIQEALKEQLTTHRDALIATLRQKQAHLESAQAEREQKGVLLYGHQQQLARAQDDLEKLHGTLLKESESREDAAKVTEARRAVLSEVTKERDRISNEVRQHQDHLDRLGFTLYQIEQYQAAIKDEVLLTQRAAHKTESDAQVLEKLKEDQDARLADLDEMKKVLEEEIGLVTAQLVAQERETSLARSTLQEAQRELEEIQFERGQLQRSWQSALIGLQRRHEALKAMEDALHEQEQQLETMEGEVEAVVGHIGKEQQTSMELTQQVERLKAEHASLKAQQASEVDKRDKLLLSIRDFQVRISELEVEHEGKERSMNERRRELQRVMNEHGRVMNQIKEVEDAIRLIVSENTTLKTDIQKTMHDIEKLKLQIVEEESHMFQDENESVRVDIDLFNADHELSEQESKLHGLEGTIKEKEESIDRFMTMIRRKHDEINKKQSQVEFLNRKLETMMTGIEEENLGPLEATIVNIKRSIEKLGQESKSIEGQWLRFQTELLGISQKLSTENTVAEELETKIYVLEERYRRLESEAKATEEEIRRIQNQIHGDHKKIKSINAAIDKHRQTSLRLEDESFNMETEFVNSLKYYEKETIELEMKIKQIEEDREVLRAQLIEQEQIRMLCENKIQTHKETQTALDPTVGQAEIAKMRKEISRMKIRYRDLRRRHQDLTAQTTAMVKQRTQMQIKAMASAARKSSQTSRGRRSRADSAGVTARQSHNREISRLRRQLDSKNREIELSSDDLKSLIDHRSRTEQTITELSAQCDEARNLQRELEERIRQGLLSKHRNLELISRTQKMTERLRAIQAGKITLNDERLEHSGDDLAVAEERKERLMTLLELLIEQHPAVDRDVARLSNRLSVASSLVDSITV